MTDAAIDDLSATELADAVRRKALSPVEIVGASLARIEAVNPLLNCFCFVYPEEALARARTAEGAVMAGDPIGPLHGVPIAFKDMTPTRGRRTTLGSYIYRDWVPDYDAVIVERLLGAGAILVGKTTTPELAATGFTESKLWGVTRNPWDTGRGPGGSSGGSAAAVAARCLPLAEGCDMGGSVRIPAAYCGIVGLKPSFGRIPFDILPSRFDSYCHFGPLARTIDDAALFLALAQGHDDRDPLSIPATLDIPQPVPADVRGLRCALSIDLGYYAVDPEIAADVGKAAELLQSLGAIVEPVELAWTRQVNDIGYRHWEAYMAAIAGPHLDAFRDRMDPFLVAAIEAGQRMSAVELKTLEIARSEVWEKLRPLFRSHDVLLCPTVSVPAPPIGTAESDFGYDGPDGRFHQYEMTFPFNLTSACPALSVPAGLTKAGLPTALQIVGRPYDDLTVLRAGAALERAGLWRGLTPPLQLE